MSTELISIHLLIFIVPCNFGKKEHTDSSINVNTNSSVLCERMSHVPHRERTGTTSNSFPLSVSLDVGNCRSGEVCGEVA